MIDVVQGLSSAPPEDSLARTALAHRAGNLLRPARGLHRLDEVAAWLGAWQRTDTPSVDAPVLVIAAGDHGVADRGVSAQRPDMTVATIDAIRAGAATSTVMAGAIGVAMRLVDVGAGTPTGDIVVEDALSPERFESAFAAGRDAVATITADLLLVGDIGVGATTSASAVALCLHGGDVDGWVGSGSGIDDAGVQSKVDVVRSAVARVGSLAPLEALRRLGGAEMVAICGAVFEARMRSLPVVLDGFVTTVAASVLESTLPGSLDHAWAAHLSTEPGHARILEALNKRPLLDLELAHGEGSGALLALPIIRAAAVAVSDVATVDEWGVR